MQKICNSSALALELHLFGIKFEVQQTELNLQLYQVII